MSATHIMLLFSLAVTVYLSYRVLQSQRALRRFKYEVDRMLEARAEERASQARLQREAPEHDRRTRAELLEELLSVDDHVQRALEHRDADPEALIEGLELLARDLEKTWAALGAERVAPEPGEAFEPERHEAIAAEPSEVEDKRVAKLHQAGFVYQGKLLRPAKVSVLLPEKSGSDEDDSTV